MAVIQSVFLLALISAVRGQSLTSSEPVTHKAGQSAILSCKVQGMAVAWLHWIRQKPLEALEWIGRIDSGTGTIFAQHLQGQFSITKDTSKNTVSLTVKSLKPEDSAVYYCAREAYNIYGGTALDVWGKGTTVTVQPDGSSVSPSLFVLSPLQTPSYPLKTADQLGPDVCLATDFRPKGEDMVLNVKGGPVNVSTDGAVLSKNNTYYFAAFSNETIHSCGMDGTFSNNEADDVCGSIYPEKAKLNFYLLLMNGVRVVFTKALAFSTVLTIRGLLF